MTEFDPHWPTAAEWLAAGDGDADLLVTGVPTSAGSLSASDAWQTPAALRRTLRRFSTFDGETGTDLAAIRAGDGGDWRLAELSAADAVEAIAKHARELPPEPIHVFLGGDNLITYPLVANLPGTPLERRGVLTFDAHHDVREVDGRLSNGAPIRLLIEDGLPGTQVVQIGIHSFANSRYYRRWCQERGIRVATMPMVDQYGIARLVEEALEYLAAKVDAIHVDLDLDVLDRAYAPGCPGARPGGLTPRQLADAARICGRHERVRSIDLVEVDATRDVAETTIMNVATMFLAFASGVAERDADREAER